MRQNLIDSLTRRYVRELVVQNPVSFIKEYKPEDYIDAVTSIVYLYTRAGKGRDKKLIQFSEVISAIGHAIRTKYKLKRDSALSAKLGAFLLYSFQELGMIQVSLEKAPNGHNVYGITVTNEDALGKLWNVIDESVTEKLPSLTPYPDWLSGKQPNGTSLVKTNSKDVISSLSPETHPIVFNCVNRAQKVGWMVNAAVYEIYTWALRNKADAFHEIWEMQSQEAKTSKLREAKAIGTIAKRFMGKIFYHLYYLDFRGRKYPATAYFHEQGTDLAKGLLLRADSKPITEQGYYWLLISIASNWAGDAGREDQAKTDKIPLNDRVYWAEDNEEILMSYAVNPKVNQGWMRADKPWQFLAACMEWHKAKSWVITANFGRVLQGLPPLTIYDYVSHLECYIDGSTNGSQHLAALMRDEVTAPYVNLIPQELPGDLYRYVAEHVWHKLDKITSKLSSEQSKACNEIIDNLKDIKKQISDTPERSDRRKEAYAEMILYKEDHKDSFELAAPVFWNRIKDAKERRKIVKRGVMTLPYGGTAYGLGQQVIDDSRKHGIDLLLYGEHKWSSYMGKLIFDDCRESLKRPMRLLSIFESVGKKAEADGKFLKWSLPLTNFPVVQHYVEGKVRKIYVQYGPQDGYRDSSGYYENTFQVNICFIEDTKPSKKKQSQAAAPNAIHSLDAAHLMLACSRTEFPVTTIHDSFGCLLSEMPELFVVIRETFVELYNQNPLKVLLEDMGGSLDGIEMGNLDISLILDSEYAFS